MVAENNINLKNKTNFMTSENYTSALIPHNLLKGVCHKKIKQSQ